MPKLSSGERLDLATATLKIEADAIISSINHIGDSFSEAIDLLLNTDGKIVLCGMGKSGAVAQKIAATLSSTGTPAVFLHPADAVHGDLGVYKPGDVTILLSKSGSTLELLRLLPLLREFGSKTIGILGNLNSPLAREVDVALDATVQKEADALNLAPTASTVVALAIGDALVSVLEVERNIKPSDFAKLHPGGQLGKNLWYLVSEVMHKIDKVSLVHPTTTLKDVLISMTRYPLGAACVVDDQNRLIGIITDGDLRRELQKVDDIRNLSARDMMTSSPVFISPEKTLSVAVELMENRSSQISVLPVLSKDGICLGLIRIHDIYQGAQ